MFIIIYLYIHIQNRKTIKRQYFVTAKQCRKAFGHTTCNLYLMIRLQSTSPNALNLNRYALFRWSTSKKLWLPVEQRGYKHIHKRPGRLSLMKGGVISHLCHMERLPGKHWHHQTAYGVWENLGFFQPMICCINFCFEFYFPKCPLKEHSQITWG